MFRGIRSESWDVLKKKYSEIKTMADVTPAVDIANAYDAMHLTALAIARQMFSKALDLGRSS